MNNKSSANAFYGSATKVQIQQDTINSNQTIIDNSDGVDFEKVCEIFSQVRNNIDSLGVSDDVKTEILTTINTVQKNVDTRTEPHRIKQALATINDFLIGVSGSLAASGILYLISQL